MNREFLSRDLLLFEIKIEMTGCGIRSDSRGFPFNVSMRNRPIGTTEAESIQMKPTVP